jgi:hypothetical protein
MPFFNSLLISALLLGEMPFSKGIFQSDKCPDFVITYTVDQPQIGQFTVSINPKGGKAPYKVVLSEESGQLASDNFTKTRFENLKKGKYICVIVDSDKCLRKTEISVQP